MKCVCRISVTGVCNSLFHVRIITGREIYALDIPDC